MRGRSILDPKPDPIQNRKKFMVICFCTMVGLFSSLAYAHFGADYGGITQNHSYGFIFSTTASILQLICGILACLYFARNDTTFRIPIRLLIFMIIQLAFCLLGIIFFNIQLNPSKAEVKEHVISKEPGVFHRGFTSLEEELHCCGVDSYEDYKYTINGEISWQVPFSCCNYQNKNISESNCAYPQRNPDNPPDYIRGCFNNLQEFSQFQELAPGFYRIYNLCRFLIVGTFMSSLIFSVTVYGYFDLFYKRHKLYTNNLMKPEVPNYENPTNNNVSSPSTERQDISQPSTSSSSNNSFVTEDEVKVPNQNTITTRFKNESTTANSNVNSIIATTNNNHLNNNNTDFKFIESQMNVNVNVELPSKLIKTRTQQIDFEKVKEMSMEQLPGSLSQLSAYIYPNAHHLQNGNLIETNTNKLV